jgi:4-amino-4-deoxy-L-arabinose transferase-like glycosyltransferase
VVREVQRRRWALAGAALCVLAFVVLAGSRILYPYDVGEYEANAWAPGSLLAHFHNPYSQDVATHAPFTAAPYGPVFYALVGFGGRLFGDQFWFARILLLGAGLGSAWLVFRIASRFTSDRFAAVLAAGLLLAQYPMLKWAGVQRPDVLAMFLALFGMNLAFRGREESANPWYPAWSALALLAAVSTRQTYVLPLFVVVLWYWLEQADRALRMFVLTLVVAGGSVLGVLLVGSHGGLITQLITNQAQAPSQLSTLSNHLRALAESPVSWLTALLLGLAALNAIRSGVGPAIKRAARRGREPDARQRLILLLVLYLVIATAFALASGSRAGSNINYFIEPLAIASLIVGLASSGAIWVTSDSGRIAVALALCAGVIAGAGREGHGELLRWRAKPYFDQIVDKVRGLPSDSGPVYSEYPELADGRISYVNDFVQYDGRSPALRNAFDRLLTSGKLAAVIRADPDPPSGYTPVPLSEPDPSGVYVVHLSVRHELASALAADPAFRRRK